MIINIIKLLELSPPLNVHRHLVLASTSDFQWSDSSTYCWAQSAAIPMLMLSCVIAVRSNIHCDVMSWQSRTDGYPTSTVHHQQ